MSVHVMERNPQPQTSAAPDQYSQGGYEASFGTYQIDESAHTLQSACNVGLKALSQFNLGMRNGSVHRRSTGLQYWQLSNFSKNCGPAPCPGLPPSLKAPDSCRSRSLRHSRHGNESDGVKMSNHLHRTAYRSKLAQALGPCELIGVKP
jgi:hypothetical protein